MHRSRKMERDIEESWAKSGSSVDVVLVKSGTFSPTSSKIQMNSNRPPRSLAAGAEDPPAGDRDYGPR